MQVLSSVFLTYRQGSSDKFYEVKVAAQVISGRLEAEVHTRYGRTGTQGVSNVNASMHADLQDVDSLQRLSAFCRRVLKEANGIISAKLKKGYQGKTGHFDAQVENGVKALVKISSGDDSPATQNNETNVKQSVNVLVAEVINMVQGKATLAVLEDADSFQYRLLGVARNPHQLQVSIGTDVVYHVNESAELVIDALR